MSSTVTGDKAAFRYEIYQAGISGICENQIVVEVPLKGSERLLIKNNGTVDRTEYGLIPNKVNEARDKALVNKDLGNFDKSRDQLFKDAKEEVLVPSVSVNKIEDLLNQKEVLQENIRKIDASIATLANDFFLNNND